MSADGPKDGRGGKNCTYILRCGDGSLYTGWTNDLVQRVKTHAAGKGARYTRSRLPVQLVWWEIHPSRSAAMRREWAIKRMTRAEKLALIAAGPVCPAQPEKEDQYAHHPGLCPDIRLGIPDAGPDPGAETDGGTGG